MFTVEQTYNMAHMLNNGKNKEYFAGLYLRLSRDDNNGSQESMSIQSQKIMLTQYAEEKGYNVTEIYIDDGFSGTNFERPSFKRMLKDIQLGKINMVLTKDLSRLGRNYVQTGQYTDFFFPDNNVRYIAINDNVDTAKDDNEIAPFKNILNEMYARDISKKIRSARKVAAKQGKFLGSVPSFGYKRSPENKHQLIIDEEAAAVVRRIFQMYLNHTSGRFIAEALNREKIASPKLYYHQSTGLGTPPNKNSSGWTSSTIMGLLRKEVYVGDTVQSKRAVKSFKTKEIAILPPEMWVVVKGTHEPIIDLDTFIAVQNEMKTSKFAKPRKTSKTEEISLFAGVLRCKCCGSKMIYGSTQRKTGKDYYYRCSRYVQSGNNACTPHRISDEKLYNIVLQDIQKNAQMAIEDEENFIQQLYQLSFKEKTAELDRFKKRELKILNRLAEVDNLIQSTFEKNISGALPDNMMTKLLNTYNNQQEELQQELDELRNETLKSKSQTSSISKEIEQLKKYATITKLDRKTITTLIQSIHLSEPAIKGKERIYQLEIRYKFQNCNLGEGSNTVVDATELKVAVC